MILRFFKMIGHGTLMMARTLRNYAMLSMSVVLSFSVLLGYLVYTDSSLFNQYKNVLYKPDGWISVVDMKKSSGDIVALQQLTKDIPSYVMTLYSGDHLNSPDDTFSYNFLVYTIPSFCWGVIYPNSSPPERVDISWLDGRETDNITLGVGEIIISKAAYDVLLADKEGEKILPVSLLSKDPTTGRTVSRWLDCTVVGTIDYPDHYSNSLSVSELSNKKRARLHIYTYMSQATMDKMMAGSAPYGITERFVIYNTTNPEYVIKSAEQVGMKAYNVYERKTEAMREMQIHAQTKMIIVLLMFVLLGINLYGSFSNALDRRRFEVGIKRAIGASKAAIIGQFMWESLLLMIINTFISVVLVFNGFLWYKYFWEAEQNFNPFRKWTIYINGTSVAMFAIVTLSLTLLFSIIFAVKATQVQVVEYLKAE